MRPAGFLSGSSARARTASASKGAMGCGLAPSWAADAGTAVAAFCGHLFPVFISFKGGKGVATAGGAYLAVAPVAIVGVLIAFGLGLGMSRRVSVGSLAAASALPACVAFATHSPALTLAALVIAVGIGARHRENIERLLAGKEPRLF